MNLARKTDMLRGVFGSWYSLETLQQCGRGINTKSQKVRGLILAFREVIGEGW